MRKSSISVTLCLSLLLVSCSHSAKADVITPGMEDGERHFGSLAQAAMVATKTGTFQQQVAAANNLYQYYSQPHEAYNSQALNANLELTDIYWSNGHPAYGKQLSAGIFTGLDLVRLSL